ncbi:MAG: MBOAT family protein [Planctomycetia bacterium]|nr:MBOAT family protein [Planctomycetia bacterium]
MRFNSPVYLAFLPIVVLAVWLAPARAHRWVLLAASYVFYASWHWPYLGLLVGSAALNHWGARWIVAGPPNRKLRGGCVLAANVLLLAEFKYLSWLCENVNAVGSWLGITQLVAVPQWILPLGISFYVFEAISYTVDIIRKRERIHSFWDFQLFIAFFPKLIAGPIMRAKELLPQIENPQTRLDSSAFLGGLWMIVSGLFLKIVLADGIAPDVDRAFSRPFESIGATDVYCMSVAFGLQIYLDFSSYTRMAIGSARLCGIQLVDNFNYPYSATSPVDFWNRWHISLSRWIRDYLFFPLLGKKATLGAMCRAALLSMALCGIWHGAGWSFLLWGLYHGGLIAGYHILTYRQRTSPSAVATADAGISPAKQLLAMLSTFALVSLGWVLFRSATTAQALGLLQRALMPWEYSYRALSGTFYLHTALLTLAIWASPRVTKYVAAASEAQPSGSAGTGFGYWLAQGSLAGMMLVLCLIYLRGQTAFIYFQF